ncbi:MAG: hypothetical protein NC238_10410 [Dehalobacter sp.]|nr:hypothetical protein [Dehalobacter sp.]
MPDTTSSNNEQYTLSTKGIPKLSLKYLERMDEPLDDEYLDLPDETFKRLDSETKETLVRERIRFAVRRYGIDGITLDELVKITNHDKKTVQNHLNALMALREVYSQKKNLKLTYYYPNGKPLHDVGKKIIEINNNSEKTGGTYYEVSLAKGRDEKLFFHILEKKFSLLEGDKVEGAILLPLDSLDQFIKCFTDFQNEFGDVKNE